MEKLQHEVTMLTAIQTVALLSLPVNYRSCSKPSSSLFIWGCQSSSSIPNILLGAGLSTPGFLRNMEVQDGSLLRARPLFWPHSCKKRKKTFIVLRLYEYLWNVYYALTNIKIRNWAKFYALHKYCGENYTNDNLSVLDPCCYVIQTSIYALYICCHLTPSSGVWACTPRVTRSPPQPRRATCWSACCSAPAPCWSRRRASQCLACACCTMSWCSAANPSSSKDCLTFYFVCV